MKMFRFFFLFVFLLLSGCSTTSMVSVRNGHVESSYRATYTPWSASLESETFSQPFQECMAEKGFVGKTLDEDISSSFQRKRFRRALKACRIREDVQDRTRNRRLEYFPYNPYYY